MYFCVFDIIKGEDIPDILCGCGVIVARVLAGSVECRSLGGKPAKPGKPNPNI